MHDVDPNREYMPKATLTKLKTHTKQRAKFEVPDGYDVLTPSPRNDTRSSNSM